jgi:hypothetical protein
MMSEEQQSHLVMKTYADLVHAGVPENIVCRLFISCGISLLPGCCCPEHPIGELALVEQALADARADLTPKMN